ncbi:MAG TPA: FIST N-terminal domain-containing protein [Chitinophagaceae bacterium]|nr:FIST N-terminal domain-containing protein [Chitinophagaceae bacterium]
MQAKAIKGKSPDEIRSALLHSMAEGFRPTLAIVFISTKQDRNAVCGMLHDKGIDVIGATSCGEFINGHQDQGSIALLLLDLPRDVYTILFEDIGQGDIAYAAKEIAHNALKKFKDPAFILLSTGVSRDGVVFNGELLIRSMEKAIGPQVNIFGGMAGDDYSFTGSYVFTETNSSDIGVVALVMDEEKISLLGNAISGWQAVGTVKTVTKSEDDWVYTIDGQPAPDMYLKYLGKQAKTEQELKTLYEDIGLFYPFQVIDSADPVMRTPMMIDKDRNAIKFDFAIPEGTKLQFSMPPDFDIVENVLSDAGEIKNATHFNAEALLIFSCAGRLNALGPLTNSENDGLHEVWKAPMAGFFTYGEFGKGKKGKQEFHSTTCCWVALKEK